MKKTFNCSCGMRVKGPIGMVAVIRAEHLIEGHKVVTAAEARNARRTANAGLSASEEDV